MPGKQEVENRISDSRTSRTRNQGLRHQEPGTELHIPDPFLRNRSPPVYGSTSGSTSSTTIPREECKLLEQLLPSNDAPGGENCDNISPFSPHFCLDHVPFLPVSVGVGNCFKQLGIASRERSCGPVVQTKLPTLIASCARSCWPLSRKSIPTRIAYH